MSPFKNGETRSCKLCGVLFYRKKSAILKGGGVFCSRKCSRYVPPNRILKAGEYYLLEVESVSRGFRGYAKIDKADVKTIRSFGRRWCAAWHECTQQFFVASNEKIDGKWTRVMLHRLLMDAPKGLDVDHVNHDMLDCRRSNLRICSRGENLQNRKGPQSTSTTGIRNVYWRSDTGKFVAEIKVNNKKISLGCFVGLADAERAAINGRKRYMTHSSENSCQK